MPRYIDVQNLYDWCEKAADSNRDLCEKALKAETATWFCRTNSPRSSAPGMIMCGWTESAPNAGGCRMDRLTIRNSDGSVSQPTSTTIKSVFEKLAAYEDTGLMPEEMLFPVVVHCANCHYAERRKPTQIKTEIFCKLFCTGMRSHDFCSRGVKEQEV